MKLRMFFCAAVLAAQSLLFAGTVPAQDKNFEEQMKKYLQTPEGQEAVGKAVEAYVRGLQNKAQKEEAQRQQNEMEEQFKNPVDVPVGASPVLGPKDAKVTVVEFSDFQCPFCRRGAATMDKLREIYPKDVKIVFKNLPLPMHPHAESAAKAALAAGEQGKFWEMADALFQNQGKLGEELYEQKAKELGLNVEKFKKDMESPKVAEQIASDKKLAQELGLQGTPAFYVNGVAVRGAYPVDHFKKIIDRWLSNPQQKK